MFEGEREGESEGEREREKGENDRGSTTVAWFIHSHPFSRISESSMSGDCVSSDAGASPAPAHR